MGFYDGVEKLGKVGTPGVAGPQGVRGAQGATGPQGVGFKLDGNGNYDIQNKKLSNVGRGTGPNDVVTKSQIQLLDNTPGNVQADKAVIYSDTGSIHTDSMYLQDTPDGAGNFNSVRLLVEQQSYDNIHLHIPDLQNFDGYGGRARSEVVVTSTDQNITGRKTFPNCVVLKPTSNAQAANKKYVDDEIKKVPTPNLPSVLSAYVKKDGSTSMTGNLDMGNKQIKSIAEPTDASDATTKKYFEDRLEQRLEQSHLVTSHKTNEFKYLKDSNESSSEYNITVNGIVDFNGSPHQNKKAYSMVLTKDVGTNDYRSRIGFNIYSLDIGTYTIVFEFYPPEMTNIQLFCTASEAYIHKSVQRDFSDYSKLLVQFNNNSKLTPDYIYLTMHGTAAASRVQSHIVVYGVKDWSDSVYPGIYDGADNVMFKYVNGDTVMQTDLDMNDKKIIHLSDPVDDGDAVNKLSLDSVSYYTKNHVYRSIFPKFYDLVETSRFNLIKDVMGVVIDKIHPNLILKKNRFINDYDPNNGLKLSRSTHMRMSKIWRWTDSFTFFMSFKHDETKTCRISWSHMTPFPMKLYPRYEIAADQFRIDFGRIKGLSQQIQSVSFTNDFKNKQLCIWICYDATQRLYKMALSNYISHVNQVIPRSINSQSDQFEIDYLGFVNKIGFVGKFIDIDSLDFHRILLEEKRAGSYLV